MNWPEGQRLPALIFRSVLSRKLVPEELRAATELALQRLEQRTIEPKGTKGPKDTAIYSVSVNPKAEQKYLRELVRAMDVGLRRVDVGLAFVEHRLSAAFVDPRVQSEPVGPHNHDEKKGSEWVKPSMVNRRGSYCSGMLGLGRPRYLNTPALRVQQAE
jgi:hypothetical protein